MKRKNQIRCKLLRGEENCFWVRETYLKPIVELPAFGSFYIYGNEDCPERIQLFAEDNPQNGAKVIRDFSVTEDGEYIPTPDDDTLA